MRPSYDNKSSIVLFPGTCIVKGKNRSIIQNVVKSNFDIIPNEVSEIVEELKDYCINDIYEKHGVNNVPIINSYFDFIIEKGYGFISDERVNFSNLHENIYHSWDAPFMITNAMIDYNINYDADYKTAIEALGLIGCDIVQVRFLNNEKLRLLIKL